MPPPEASLTVRGLALCYAGTQMIGDLFDSPWKILIVPVVIILLIVLIFTRRHGGGSR
jgi:Na+/H+-dicarboxylate symporter